MSGDENLQENGEQMAEPTSKGWVQMGLEIAAVLWAIALMVYFYYSKGYVELIRQIGGLIFG